MASERTPGNGHETSADVDASRKVEWEQREREKISFALLEKLAAEGNLRVLQAVRGNQPFLRNIFENFEKMGIDLSPVEIELRVEIQNGGLRGEDETLRSIYQSLEVYLDEIIKAFKRENYFHPNDVYNRAIQDYVLKCQGNASIRRGRLLHLEALKDKIEKERALENRDKV